MLLQNPVLPIDFPDPDIIRMGYTYYMASSSLHFTPGVPVLRSKNLANWENASYVCRSFGNDLNYELAPGRTLYGWGIQAPSLRHHNGVFYLCFNARSRQATTIFRTTNIETGPWEKSTIPGHHHDPSLLFLGDCCFLVYGQGTIYIKELLADASAVKPNGVDQILLTTPRVNGLNCEGSHIYHINGMFYLFLSQWPCAGNNRLLQWCYRSPTLLGHYEGRVVLDDAMGYRNNGIARGGIVDTPAGDWFALFTQDREAVGHCPVLVPLYWQDGWPVLGEGGHVPAQLELPCWPQKTTPLVASDDFDYNTNRLGPMWQWNHNPDPQRWSVTQRRGHLRLINGEVVHELSLARNVLTQKTVAPHCTFETRLDSAGMQPGDVAGLAAFQSQYAFIGLAVDKRGARQVVAKTRSKAGGSSEMREAYRRETIHLRIDYDFSAYADSARFFFSVDGRSWKRLGEIFHMRCTNDHFAGYRTGLFSYATQTEGGHADFDYLRIRYGQEQANTVTIPQDRLWFASSRAR
ncbi:MAG: family 43 glycosylhydrolase [Ruminococcaceae bacterium]|nr:family 43 glycosylhydrolase [Oscillospiraceae bacterium]